MTDSHQITSNSFCETSSTSINSNVPTQAMSASSSPSIFSQLYGSLFSPIPNASAYIVYNNYARAVEERIQAFLTNDPNQYGPEPAAEEDINKLEEIKHDIESAGVENNSSCSICREEYKQDESLVKLPCQHDYHKECVKEWLSKHNSCPMCRQAI